MYGSNRPPPSRRLVPRLPRNPLPFHRAPPWGLRGSPKRGLPQPSGSLYGHPSGYCSGPDTLNLPSPCPRHPLRTPALKLTARRRRRALANPGPLPLRPGHPPEPPDLTEPEGAPACESFRLEETNPQSFTSHLQAGKRQQLPGFPGPRRAGRGGSAVPAGRGGRAPAPSAGPRRPHSRVQRPRFPGSPASGRAATPAAPPSSRERELARVCKPGQYPPSRLPPHTLLESEVCLRPSGAPAMRPTRRRGRPALGANSRSRRPRNTAPRARDGPGPRRLSGSGTPRPAEGRSAGREESRGGAGRDALGGGRGSRGTVPGIRTPGKWGRGGDAESGHLEALGGGEAAQGSGLELCPGGWRG